jgi:hypothetical protein
MDRVIAKKLNELIELQVDRISELSRAELRDLVRRGFPAYSKFSDKQVEKEWEEEIGMSESRPVIRGWIRGLPIK